ncbi:flavodoxin-like fold protein [Rachicladosporium monterosium]|uniref:Flavodoxin-like fold protein n=1 Tax=Rachicladosporium monterosium TaxID=1507873 RepID=A0ABR0KYI8_9PEZI|nr:flavodoxin-like fold protein [Rachicladosporium monterosium]
MAPKIAIVYYSMYGHIKQLAEAEAKGIKEAGGSVDMYQIPETLPEEVLKKMYAAPKDTSIATIDDPKVLEQYDGVLFGIPTRYGNFPAQWKAFLDKTGGQWQSGAFWGKEEMAPVNRAQKELELAEKQGHAFYQAVAKVNFA